MTGGKETIMPLIADEKLLFESPSPQDIYCYTPALCRGFGGRIVAGFDLGGPGTEKLAGPRSDSGDYPCGNQLRILLSDDGGASWRESASRLPMLHTMLFRAGKFLYAIGQSGRLVKAGRRRPCSSRNTGGTRAPGESISGTGSSIWSTNSGFRRRRGPAFPRS